MQAHEIEQALSGMDTAQGTPNKARPPANSEIVMVITGYKIDRSKNKNSPLNGCAYAIIEGTCERSTSDAMKPGDAVATSMDGLDSKMNNGSLANKSQAELRAATAAILKANPEAPPPGGRTWPATSAFLAANERAVIGRKIRIVSGPPKGVKGFTDKTFFPAD